MSIECGGIHTKYRGIIWYACSEMSDAIYTGTAKLRSGMEFSTRYPFLDQFGKPLPDRIQHVLDELAPRLRRKFAVIRDEVVLVEILEQAGQQITKYESENGAIDRLYGFGWVTVRNVAISRLRRCPHILEEAGSRESVAALARLTADEGSPGRMERSVLIRQVLKHISERERKIAIWKKGGFSSRWIAEKLGISVSSVDTTYSRVQKKLQKLLGPDTGSAGCGTCR